MFPIYVRDSETSDEKNVLAMLRDAQHTTHLRLILSRANVAKLVWLSIFGFSIHRSWISTPRSYSVRKVMYRKQLNGVVSSKTE